MKELIALKMIKKLDDLRQDDSYAEYIEKIGWDFTKIDGVYCYIKKIPLLGSLVKIQRPTKIISLDNLLNLVKKYKVKTIYIEPSDIKQSEYYLRKGKFNKSSSIFLPAKTIHIDLSKSEENLLKEMHYKTRYNIGLSQRRGVLVERSRDIDEFAELWQENSKSWGMYLPQKKEIKSLFQAFANDATIFFAKKLMKILGGVLIISTKDISYYMYAFSTDTGKKYFAPTLLTWEAIKYAKSKGKKIFDFGGIYDDRFPLNSWKGFSRFKESFGGKPVEYPGVLVKSYLPFGITF